MAIRPQQGRGGSVFALVVVVCLGTTCLLPDMVPAAGIRGIYSAEAETAFERALSAYRDARVHDARDQLERLLRQPVHQHTSAAMLMLARAQYRLEEYDAARETATELEQRFTHSRYVPYALLLQGDSCYARKRYSDAAVLYGRLLDAATPLQVKVRAAERLAALAENALIDTAGMDRIRHAVGEQRWREAVSFGRARWYGTLGWKAQSREALQAYLERYPEGVFLYEATRRDWSPATAAYGDATALPADTKEVPAPETLRAAPGGRRIGLLLPLTGSSFERQVGEDLYAGVQLANEEAGSPFELVVADVGMDYGDLPIAEQESKRLVRVIRQTRRLIYEEGVVAITGPVFSAECVAAAVVAESAGIPIIAPLAQQSGLDQTGRHVFQLNAIPEVQARSLAEHATLVLGLRHLAVVAPLTDYGWTFEREFQRAARKNGGEIVFTDWYVPEVTKDFRRMFNEMRQVGFSLMPPAPTPLVPATEADYASYASQAPSFLVELLAGLEGTTGEADRAAVKETPADSSEIFIDTIDGVVLVVEHFGDAQTIAPQLHYHRLQTQILGNDIWYEPERIRQLRPADRAHLEGTVLVAGSLEEDPAARSFIDAFRRRFARNPGYAAYGYDAARLLEAAWSEGHRTPAQLRDWLANVRNYEGASGRISFRSDRRVNEELDLLKIDTRGRIRRLTERDLPALTGTGARFPVTELNYDLPRASLQPGELDTVE